MGTEERREPDWRWREPQPWPIVLSLSDNEGWSVKRLRRETAVVLVCAIQHVVMCLPLQVLSYSQSVRWWACAYLQLPGFTQRKHRGKPKPVKPTHRDVKLMPRLLLPFNQNWEKSYISPSACLFVFLCLSLCLCLLLCLPDWQTTNLQCIRFKPASLNYTLSQFMERSEVGV